MNQPYPLTKEQVRLLLLYDFRIKKKAANSIADINTAFGPGTVSKSTAYDWHSRFQKGNESLEDQPRAGRPSEFDNSALQEALEANNRQTSRELADLLGVSHTTILHHLAELGKKAKLGCWVPHKLDDRDRHRRVDMAISLLSRSRRTDWLDSVVTGDEKWTFYANIRRKRQWVDAGTSAEREPRQELHPKKIMLSVFWDSKGIIMFDLLPQNTTITAAYYCQQLDRLQQKLAETRPERQRTILLHDNARPHTARQTHLKLLDLCWEVLPHPPYSPDLAPSDYHLFVALDRHMGGKQYANQDDLKTDLANFFVAQPPEFYWNGIHSLHKRWREVVEANGDYIHD